MNKINWQERINQLLANGQKKSYFTIGVTILFVVVMSIVGVVPALSSLGSQAEDNSKRDEIIKKLDTKLNNLKSLTLAKDSQSELIDYFNEIMPNEVDQKGYVNLVAELDQKNGLEVGSFVFDKESRDLVDRISGQYGERVKPMYLTVLIDGQKDQVLAFMKSVEESARIMDINDFSLIRVPTYDNSGVLTGTTYNLTLKLIIYNYE